MFDSWKIGDKEKDNGILFLIALNDHHDRIEVGRGLEGEVTDIESRQILDTVVNPELKQGHVGNRRNYSSDKH